VAPDHPGLGRSDRRHGEGKNSQLSGLQAKNAPPKPFRGPRRGFKARELGNGGFTLLAEPTSAFCQPERLPVCPPCDSGAVFLFRSSPRAALQSAPLQKCQFYRAGGIGAPIDAGSAGGDLVFGAFASCMAVAIHSRAMLRSWSRSSGSWVSPASRTHSRA